MPHLEPFIRKNDDGIPCYTHKDISYFQGQKKSVVENGTCYDLIDILEHYKGSYGVHRNTSLAGMSNSPLIGSHRGEDYYRKNDQL
ncbi:hypothetical protein KBC03_06115 [Patescibacteria group bacterium]|nr:hypothetical protein [Patescibacteria group bacterium]